MITRTLILTGLFLAMLPAGQGSARAQWTVQRSHAPPASFRAVQAVNARVVWVAGSGGACLRTTNGGGTWETLSVPDAGKLDFRGVFAFDSLSAILISSGEAERGLARIYRTTNAGRTWQVVFQTGVKGVFLDGVAFWDRSNGLAVGDPIDGKWYLLRTSDGGRTWARLASDGLPAMLPGEGAFAASNSSMALAGDAKVRLASGSAARARVFISTDCGHAWDVMDTPMPSGATSGIFSLKFWDGQHGVGVGGDYKLEKAVSDNVILSSDGGRVWRKGASTNPPGLKEGVVMLPGNRLVAVGPSGTSVSRDFGSSWQKVDETPLHGISCAEGQCWAVGGRGVIARWNGN